ncbi:Regulator of ribonuclease activity B [Luteibacter sp. UNCMF366Tsu5.1]|nr:Regulator of ribonuclease activity B [Luteibacter sp. UNCMF366Tsu5.1]
MSIVDELVSTVSADIDLLRIRDGQGNVFAHRRPVDFVFVTESEPQATNVAGFLADYRYADTSVTPVNGEFRVVATIVMSVEQQELLAVSGFMRCIAALFTVTYDGWGAPVVKSAS